MSSTNTLGTNSTPQWYLYRHDCHHNLQPYDHAPCLRQPHTTYPRWLPTETYTISSTIQKYYFLTNHNKSSITEALLIRNIQPSINNQCTGMNIGLKLFTQLPIKPSPSYSYNYSPFPSVTTYPTNCRIIPHFLHCTQINNYSRQLSLHKLYINKYCFLPNNHYTIPHLLKIILPTSAPGSHAILISLSCWPPCR